VTDSGAAFHLVGPPQGVAEALGLGSIEHATGQVELEEYPRRYAELDVAIAPLRDHPFNHSKSWLKCLEAAACGVPFVAAPVAEYQRLAALGAGLIAHDPDEWYRQVRTLAESESLREEVRAAGREAVRHLTFEERSGEWLDAWADAHRRRAGSRGPVDR
jgi:glycosyltransferase involved in cell wall biosynthesis